MRRRKQPMISADELRGLILLLMNIDDNLQRIRQEIVEDDGQAEH